MQKAPRIACVIVTYCNAPLLEVLLNDLARQTMQIEKVVVVDNSTQRQTEQMIRARFPAVRYMPMPSNTGSAGGFYEGIREAAKEGGLVLTLDDDVRMPVNAVEALWLGLEELECTQGPVGAVRAVGLHHRGSEYLPMECFAWRGTLLRATAVEQVGLPAKEYFLYADDTEYALRLRAAGYRLYYVPGSRMIESRPDGKLSCRILGRDVVFYSDAFRFYYAVRNSVHVYKRYGRYRNLAGTVAYAFKMILFLPWMSREGAGEKCTAILEGLYDGFRARLGKRLDYLPAQDRLSC
jgi:rhamnopyranosyl-N-acetylglucosaminyl-diphospho-decaprenol beta-1,3/1,4-galactofuranosyltransferase